MPQSDGQDVLAPLLQEVAVKSLASRILIAGAVLFAAGCADVVTYSKDSRNEGLRLMRAQEYADAAGAFRNATRQNPRDYQSYFYLGESYAQLSQWQQSVAAYRTSLDVMDSTLAGKEDHEFRQKVMNGYASTIAKSDAREIETNAAIQKAHSTAKANDWFLVAKIYAYRGDPDNAIDAYTRAEQINPDNFYIAKERGLYLEKLNQQAKAEPSLRRAYAINQDDAEVSAALRRLGIVPGLSLKSENTLAQPPLPKGPIPEPNFMKRTDQTAETPRD
jgi:tetratricopeptide (TPR) repeat protein